jgi:beta-lactamase class A
VTRIGLTLCLALTLGACRFVELAPPRRHSPSTTTDLQADLAGHLDSLQARTALYARDLTTGREIAIRADEPMNTASVIKLAIMVLAYRDAEEGRLDLDARRTLRPENFRRGSGVLQLFAPGLQPTNRDLVTQMIVTSDNTATDLMIATVGLDRVNRMLDSLGYTETRLRTTTGAAFRGTWELVDSANAGLTDREVFERGFPSDSGAAARNFAYTQDSTRWLGRTTARETGRLLEQIERGELAGPQSTQAMRQTLQDQVYSSRLPLRLPAGARVGHKTGDWPPALANDVGIIYTARGPIVVAVFGSDNRGDYLALEGAIGVVARDLFDAWGR